MGVVGVGVGVVGVGVGDEGMGDDGGESVWSSSIAVVDSNYKILLAIYLFYIDV